MDTDYTLTYSESSQGFPSFYSYYPDWMIGMNNYFYSFKGGNLYRHNTNEARNEFYGQLGASSITTVLNKQPLENKLFKTIAIEGTDAWIAQLSTDVGSQSGVIISTDFEEKEGNYFSYIRNEGVSNTNSTISESELKSRAVGGLGVPYTQNVGSMKFFLLETSLSIGDYIYRYDSFANSLIFVGKVTNLAYSNVPPNNASVLTVTHNGATAPSGVNIMYAKYAAAESTGLLGHYCEIKLSLPSNVTESSELFAIGADVMKSYP